MFMFFQLIYMSSNSSELRINNLGLQESREPASAPAPGITSNSISQISCVSVHSLSVNVMTELKKLKALTERERSFSSKPARSLVTSFSVLSLVIFFTSSASCRLKSLPSFIQETYLVPNKDLLTLQNESELLHDDKDGDDLSDFPAFQTNSPASETSSNRIEVPETEHNGHSKNGETSEEIRIERKNARECDVTNGSWVYDESYPLYTNSSRPFIEEGFNCLVNGRMDKGYMKWRWQPHHCDIPRFNPKQMLESIMDKRMLFIGDSVNRNQWESIVCMLMGAIEDPYEARWHRRINVSRENGRRVFKFLDYNCTVEFCKTRFLVSYGKVKVEEKWLQTMQIDVIDPCSSSWREADILIFNTGHWWNDFKTRSGINYFQEGNRVHPKLDLFTAFRSALMTWSSWIDKKMDPEKTRIFFRSMAPTHFSGGRWNSGGNCNEAKPMTESSTESYHQRNTIISDTIKQMKTPVTFLNVTSLTGYRADAHPSVYLRRNRKGYAPNNIQDCSHWCLLGVPDTWNELLYFHLQSQQ